MTSKERVSAIFILLFAALTLVWGLKLPIGGISKPGPGLFPILLSSVICLLAFILVARTYGKKETVEKSAEEHLSRWTVLYLLGDLCLYAFLFRRLGFILSTFLFLMLLKPVLEKKWSAILIGSLVISFSFFAFFTYLLKVELPMGVLSK